MNLKTRKPTWKNNLKSSVKKTKKEQSRSTIRKGRLENFMKLIESKQKGLRKSKPKSKKKKS